MPYADPQKQKQFFQAYHAKNKERRNQRKKQRRLLDALNVRKIATQSYLRHRNKRIEEKKAAYYSNHDELRRNLQLRRFGLGLEQFARMNEAQQGNCAICGQAESVLGRLLSVDHNHESGEVRGLLCVRCNTMLGMAGDSIPVLKSAIQYLQKYEFFK